MAVIGSLASLIVRFRRASPVEREQLKWILSAVAILAVTFVSGPLTFALDIPETVWQGVVLIGFAAVPIAAGIAILRYRLYDIDLIINRALVYGSLTAFLAGLYAASVQLSKLIFENVTGGSDAALILTTLLLAAAFTPAKNRLQRLVDRYFGQVSDPRKDLRAFDERLRSVIQALDPNETAQQFLDQALAILNASGGALLLRTNGRLSPVATARDWDGEGQLEIPLEHDGVQLGTLILSRRPDGSDYPPDELESLRATASLVGHALALSSKLNQDAGQVHR